MNTVRINAAPAGSKTFSAPNSRVSVQHVTRNIKPTVVRPSADGLGITDAGTIGSVPLRGLNNIQPVGRLGSSSPSALEHAYNLPTVADIDVDASPVIGSAGSLQAEPSVMDTLCLCSYDDDEEEGAQMLQQLESEDEDGMNTLCICSYDEDEHDSGMSLDVYNQLRGQLRELLAEGGAGPEHQARLERVRAALFTSLVVAFPVAGGQQEHAFEDEAETEDDILCYVD